jgi:glycosyltransferase involved in cell wall biosynthesis
LATAKLSYHARWLLYLGAPEYEAAPKVSIVIPIYNRGWLVDPLIENCVAQRYSPIEIVIVDDGSTDDTAARLGVFADRIKLISQPNGGVSAARNAGVLAATGELVQFLDSDNLLDREHIEAKVRAFAAIPDADLCYCKPTEVSLFGVRPPLGSSHAYRLLDDDDDDVSPTLDLLDSIIAEGHPFLVSAVTMPRHVFHQHGGFDTELRRGEDARYWFRLALAGTKVIGVASRLFYRCRMMDGLNEGRGRNDTVANLVCMRNVVDLLRRPERWPLVAEYLTGHATKRWRDLLSSEASTYGRDFDLLLETVAELPRPGRHRSPLPLLLFLWMLGEHLHAPETTSDLTPTSVRERLAGALVAAIGRSAPLGQSDANDWLSRAMKLRAKPVFTAIVSVSVLSELSSEPKAREAIALLCDVAGAARDGEIGTVVDRVHKKKRKKKRVKATVVVPVLGDPRTAEPTIVSCLGQTVVDQIEIILVEQEPTRTALWSQRYPRARVITTPIADRAVEAHSAGLAAATSKRIRFLLPGDILESHSVERQIEASQEFNENVAVVEVNGRRPRGLRDAFRLLTHPYNRRIELTFSAILFPVSVLAQVGGFDLALGNEYQNRYLFRLTAAGVSREFIEGTSALCGKPLAGSADQIVIAALANLIQCLGDPQLWHHIPSLTSPLTAMKASPIEDAQLHFLKIRAFDFTLKRINELSLNAASCSPLVPFTLCLIGLEWRLPSVRQSAPQLEKLRSAILKGVTDMPLEISSELSISHVLAEINDDPALAKAAASVLVALDGRPQYAGLRNILQHIQSLVPSRSRRPRGGP